MLQPDDPIPGADDYLAFARGGDPATLERALRACADRAYTQARRTLGHAADADDAVQEAFLQLARTAPRFDGTVPFGAWLGQLVRIACLRVQRSDRRRRHREEAAMVQPAPAEDLDRAEEVRALVARLPAADRAAIELHYFAGLPQAEVATALGSSENAVALRLSRARTRLRALLGGGTSVAVVTALLAAQPVHAAPPQVLAGIAPLTAAVATGAGLPATTVPLSAVQKGLLLMSAHPLAAVVLLLLAVLGAGLLPVALAAGEVRPVPPPPAVASPALAPATYRGPQPWQGKARELLPFLDPAAPVQAAIDAAHVRQLALAAKPTSLLADPRAQPALAHIREQFRLWHAAGDGAPDWAQVIAEADGAVLGLGALPQARPCFVAELGVTDASQVQAMWEGFAVRRVERGLPAGMPPGAVGGFTGLRVEQSGLLVARDGGRWAIADPGLLTAGLGRRAASIPPAGIWARIDLGDAISQLSRLDPAADPLGIGSVLGTGWRRMRPILSCTLATADGVWRAETRLTGAGRLPLRTVEPGIAGCVPPDAVVSLLLGCDPAALGTMLAPLLEPRQAEMLNRQLRNLGFDPDSLLGQFSGDLALVVRQRMPMPELGLVLGLRPGAAAALRGGLDRLAVVGGLSSEPAVGPALAAWSGFLPIGPVQALLCADRLVISTGDAANLLATPPRRVDTALEVDVDLPVLARTWLPQLLAMLPAKPTYFDELCPLADLSRHLGMLPEVTFRRPPDRDQQPLDLDRNGFRGEAQVAWRSLVGKDLPMQPHVAVYNRGDGPGGVRVVLRAIDGWRMLGWRLETYEIVKDPAILEQRLADLELRAGKPAAQLEPIVFTEPPSFDRRWLPPLSPIIEHLPYCRLRLRQTADGFNLVEDGLPLVAPGLLMLASTPHSTPGWLTAQRGAAVLRRDGPALRERHARAIAALRRTARVLASLSPQTAPLMTPSALLAAAGTDPAELASLCDGVVPDAERLDRLGYFHPSGWPHQHFGWLIPFADGLFLECHWTRAEGCDVVAAPITPQRQPTAHELARLRRLRQDTTEPAWNSPVLPEDF